MDLLLVKKLSGAARIPTKGSAGAAGYDLHAAEQAVVPVCERASISTGLAMTIPAGHYGRIAPRSGLAVKHGINVLAGVVDCDYTGVVKVCLFNHGPDPLRVSVGDRIAQLIIEKISSPDIKEVSDLDESIRGDKGFGSTGV